MAPKKSKISEPEVKPLEILSASINDEFCNYSYRILTGPGKGNIHKVEGKGHIISTDMAQAFANLNKHMAVVDDIFVHANVEIEDIDAMNGHDFSFLYIVNGISIKGSEEDESVVLQGRKYVTVSGGNISITTPKIPLTGVGGYEFKENLKAAVDRIREEVELYHNGKYTELEVEEKPNPKQESLFEGGEEIKSGEAF